MSEVLVVPLPEPLVHDEERVRIARYLDAGSAPATRLAYARSWAAWTTFCTGRGVDPLPASAEVLVIYLSARCLLYTSPSPRDGLLSRMPSSA